MAHAMQPVGTARSTGLERVGGIAAVLTAVLLLLGLVGLTIQQSTLGLRNWLIVLWQMNSGSGSLAPDPLRIVNPLDIAILVLVGLTFLGMWPVLGREHRFWTGVAVALPFVGILVFVVTGQSGRSAVMGAGLVVSVLLFVRADRRILLASIGILANGLLLAGDFGTGVLPGGLMAFAIGAGYILLLGWYALLGAGLLWSRERSASRS